MEIVVDTSVIIAVIINERNKQKIVQITRGVDLLAPASLELELGNAFSAMYKRQRINFAESIEALKFYTKIPVKLVNVNLEAALKLAYDLGIYAYDAYFLACAVEYQVPIITLDQAMIKQAKKLEIKTIEI